MKYAKANSSAKNVATIDTSRNNSYREASARDRLTGQIDTDDKQSAEPDMKSMTQIAVEHNNTGDDEVMMDDGYMYRGSTGVFKNSLILAELTGYKEMPPKPD